MFGLGPISCGAGNANLLYGRFHALHAVFDAERKFGDRELARASFSLIDEVMPASIALKRKNLPELNSRLSGFAARVKGAKSLAEWKEYVVQSKGAMAVPEDLSQRAGGPLGAGQTPR